MHVKDDRLIDEKSGAVPFIPSPNVGGRMVPTLILLHDTAGPSAESAINWFKNPRSRVSAHFVVDVDGSTTQMVECDRQAWHAGRSSWNGRSGCNAFAIGIEIVNPGKLTMGGVSWWGDAFEDAREAFTKEHGHGRWVPYTDDQIRMVREICKALMLAYPISAIARHCDVSPGRKVDVNPLFPYGELKHELAHCMQNAERFEDCGRPKWPFKVGDQSTIVRNAQEKLKALGYAQVGVVDGIFGPQTEAAVLAWEKQNGRDLNGQIDAEEYAVLMAPKSKEMPKGDVTLALEKKANTSSRNIERGASVGAALVAGEAVTSTVDPSRSLWDMSMDGLGELGRGVGHITGLGLKVDPKLVALGLVVTALLVAWRWARNTRII